MTNIVSTVLKTLCLVLVLSSIVHAGFLEMFCKSKCNLGRGGNLCKCNGFHFAGKRTMSDKYLLQNNPDLFKQFELERKPVEKHESSYRYKDDDETMNRLTEMQLAQTFLKWLISSIERR